MFNSKMQLLAAGATVLVGWSAASNNPSSAPRSAQDLGSSDRESVQLAVQDDGDAVLGPGHQNVIDNFYAIMIEADQVAWFEQAAVLETSTMTKSLTPDGVKASTATICGASGTPMPKELLTLAIDDAFPDIALDLDGNPYAVSMLDLHYSQASMWDLCERVPDNCEIAAISDGMFPNLVHGTYSAMIGPILTIGVFGQDSIEGTPTTALVPMYAVPDGATLGGWQYAEFFLLYKDELFPTELDFLFPPGTDTVIGDIGLDECLTQAVVDCITQVLGDLLEKIRRIERDYRDDYNKVLKDAQTAAERCSPLHSVSGFLRCVLTLSIEPVLAACEIWEDFDSDVNALNAKRKKDTCDAHKDAMNDIMNCLGDCPLEVREALRAAMEAAIAEMGC